MRIARDRDRGGFVLVAVLIVVTMLSLSAYTYTHWLTLEAQIADVESRKTQARQSAESGIALVEGLLLRGLVGEPVDLTDDRPELLQGVAVAPIDRPEEGEMAAATAGTATPSYRFTVFSQRHDPPLERAEALERYRLGIACEGGKVDLNHWAAHDPAALREWLIELPGGTPELVDAVFDWLDPDSDALPGGAEQDEYDALPWPVACRNGPIECLDELLQVRGISRPILEGPSDEELADGGLPASPLAERGSRGLGEEIAPGWRNHVTIWSDESTLDRSGQPRINLNDANLTDLFQRLRSEFGDDLARYVIAYRVFGPTGTIPAVSPGSAELTVRYTFGSVLDLVDRPLATPVGAKPIVSPLRSTSEGFLEQLALVLDRCMIGATPRRGRIDLRSATDLTLSIVKAITPAQRRAILEGRPRAPAGTLASSTTRTADRVDQTIAWLLRAGVTDLAGLRAIEPFVTMQGGVYGFEVVGFSDENPIRHRLRVVLDVTAPTGRRRSLSELATDRQPLPEELFTPADALAALHR